MSTSDKSAEAQDDPAIERHGHRPPSFWVLTLGSIGVVYGDIGTSPLYALDLRQARRAQEPHRAQFDAGNVVTTPRSDIMYVVTEYGIVNLKGKSVAERAQALISIAHPDFREALERQAHEHRLIPRGVSF